MNLRRMMFLLLILTTVSIVPYISSRATEHGKTIVYRGGEQGRVVYDGRVHSGKGYSCRDCHTDFARTGKQLFETQKKGLISLPDHDTDTKCFACHNEKIAFASCEGCHH
jgi:c(7)-type cytochrome triheme protein